MVTLEVMKTDGDAVVPGYSSEGAAGIDLASIDTVIIAPGCVEKIHTGIAMAIHDGYYGALYARSGLATKLGLVLSTGVSVIDSDYRGEVIVALRNMSNAHRTVHKGDRIAQIVIQPYERCEIREVQALSQTKRGGGGFGSTGR